MNIFRLAFLAALDESGISASSVSENRSDLTNLSRYRTGERDFKSATLSRYFLELPPEVQQKFLEKLAGYALLSGEVKGSRPRLSDLIKVMDASSTEDRKEAAEAMRLIVRKFLSENTDGTSNLGKSTEEHATMGSIE
jgi:hypothetical protein